MYVYVSIMRVTISVYMYVCVSVCVCVCMYVHAHTHTHTPVRFVTLHVQPLRTVRHIDAVLPCSEPRQGAQPQSTCLVS